LRNRAQAVFAIVEIRGQQPRNARSLRRFEQTLKNLESSYKRSLNATDAAVLSSLVSVGRSSGMFWASQAEGGLGGVRYIPDQSPDHQEAKIDWNEVVAVDAMGCLAGAEAVFVGCAAGAILYSSLNIADQLNR